MIPLLQIKSRRCFTFKPHTTQPGAVEVKYTGKFVPFKASGYTTISSQSHTCISHLYFLTDDITLCRDVSSLEKAFLAPNWFIRGILLSGFWNAELLCSIECIPNDSQKVAIN